MSLTLEEILNRAQTRLAQLKRAGDFDVNSAAIREAYEIIVGLVEHLYSTKTELHEQVQQITAGPLPTGETNWAKVEGAIPPQTFPDHLSVQKIADEKAGRG